MENITHEDYLILKEKESELKTITLNNAIRGIGTKFIKDAQQIYFRVFGVRVCAECPHTIVSWLKRLYQAMVNYEKEQQPEPEQVQPEPVPVITTLANVKNQYEKLNREVKDTVKSSDEYITMVNELAKKQDDGKKEKAAARKNHKRRG